MSHERGQATIDYVALIAALALLLAAAAAIAAGGAPGVTNAVLGQLRRALCIVSGGDCPVERRQPCVVASHRDARHVAVSLAIVRIDHDRYVLRERLSDGTVRLTLARRTGAGGEIGVGARLRAKISGRPVGGGAEARGGVQGVLGNGEVYQARDDREADEIVRSLGGGERRGGRAAPRPREVIVEGGIRALGRLGLGEATSAMSLEGMTDAIVGARRDQRSGHVTISLGTGRSGWALLAAVLAGPAGSYDGQVALALTLDRHSRPIELSLSASGTLAAGSTLPAGLSRPLGVGSDGASVNLAGRRWELAARADLRDPDVAAAWDAFRREPAGPEAIGGLGTRLRARAQLDARSYAVRSESGGAGAAVALGLRFGGEIDHTTDRARLLSASTRPPGGLWERRVDCVSARLAVSRGSSGP